MESYKQICSSLYLCLLPLCIFSEQFKDVSSISNNKNVWNVTQTYPWSSVDESSTNTLLKNLSVFNSTDTFKKENLEKYASNDLNISSTPLEKLGLVEVQKVNETSNDRTQPNAIDSTGWSYGKERRMENGSFAADEDLHRINTTNTTLFPTTKPNLYSITEKQTRQTIPGIENNLKETQEKHISMTTLLATKNYLPLPSSTKHDTSYHHKSTVSHKNKGIRYEGRLHHLNLVPIEDGPFGSLIWQDKKYLITVLVPIGIGILGAALIIGMAYTVRFCHRHDRRITQVKDSITNNASAQNDQVILINSSDDEF